MNNLEIKAYLTQVLGSEPLPTTNAAEIKNREALITQFNKQRYDIGRALLYQSSDTQPVGQRYLLASGARLKFNGINTAQAQESFARGWDEIKMGAEKNLQPDIPQENDSTSVVESRLFILDYSQLLDQIQTITGKFCYLNEIYIDRQPIDELRSGISITEFNNGATLLLPRKYRSLLSEIEIASHELAHGVLDRDLEKITNKQVQSCVAEAVCDLVAQECALQTLESMDQDQRISILAELTQQSVNQDLHPIAYQEYFNPDYQEKPMSVLGHIIGRKFAFQLSPLVGEYGLQHVLNFLLTNPPSPDQLKNPQGYFETMRNFKWEKVSLNPRAVLIIAGRPRFI